MDTLDEGRDGVCVWMCSAIESFQVCPTHVNNFYHKLAEAKKATTNSFVLRAVKKSQL